MNLTKTYRDKTTELEHLRLKEYINGVSFAGLYDGRMNSYLFTVSPLDYLSVAKKAVSELKTISGMDYCIMAKHPKGDTWRAL